jgi:diguanylate cyclase (GGDEF)-like protein
MDRPMGLAPMNLGACLMQTNASVLDALPIGCALFDNHGNCHYLNATGQTLLGCQPSAFLDIVFYQVNTMKTMADPAKTVTSKAKNMIYNLYPRDRLPFIQALQGRPSQVEDVMIQRQGTEVILAIQGVPLQNEQSQDYQAIVTFQDITQQKQTEFILRQANADLERLASLDGLTQIANRRHFDAHLQEHWKMMMREQRSLALILCDVDYFKQYNDTYGHPAGDTCLQAIAQILQKTVKRSGDLVSRYGGEEFAILLGNTNERGARKVAQKIQTAIAQLALPHQTSKVSQQVTLSLGIATIVPYWTILPDSLLFNADQALYRAKHNGRNQIAIEASRESAHNLVMINATPNLVKSPLDPKNAPNGWDEARAVSGHSYHPNHQLH